MPKKKTKYKTTITRENGTTYGTFISNDEATTVIRNERGRARLKKMRKKRIGVK